MPEAISALDNATYSEGIADIRELGLHGMITLRGDLESAPVKKAIKAVVGTEVPAPLKMLRKADRSVCWMSPDELLLIGPYDDAAADVAALTASLGKSHALVQNVSDARAVFEISGAHARDVLAKLTPADVSPAAFGVGDIRRSRIAQVAGAFWIVDEQTFRIVCFRSVAQYVFDLLCVAAQPGSEVNHV